MFRLTITAVFLFLVSATSPAWARIDGEVAIGEPFGVGRITFNGADVGSIDDRLIRLEEKNGRVFYPAVMPGVFGRVIAFIPSSYSLFPLTRSAVFHELTARVERAHQEAENVRSRPTPT